MSTVHFKSINESVCMKCMYVCANLSVYVRVCICMCVYVCVRVCIHYCNKYLIILYILLDLQNISKLNLRSLTDCLILAGKG